jgi:hypothetical protein
MANTIIFKAPVAAATTAALSGTFALGATPASDTITGSAVGPLTVDGYTAALNDRVLVNNQATASENGIYTITQVGSTSSGQGQVATVTFTAGAGYESGTYENVPLIGGSGFGAVATVGVNGTGPIASFNTNTIVGAGYTNGTYTDVALTGGTGSGATANIAVNNAGDVTSVVLVNAGTGYTQGDVLSAAATSLGLSTGSPTTAFAITVAAVTAVVTSVTITNGGSIYPGYDSYPNNSGYKVGDVLVAPTGYLGFTGSGFSVTVATVVPTTWVLTRSVDANESHYFNDASAVYVLNGTTNGGKMFRSSVYPLTLDAGPVSAFGTFTAGAGYNPGTYTNVPLFVNTIAGELAATPRGRGFGAVANITVDSTGAVSAVTLGTVGPISTLGTITGGTGYINGTYTNVPLTGGTGSGALATVTITNNAVSNVVVTTPGVGYAVNDVLTTSNVYLGIGDLNQTVNAGGEGGLGSGFEVVVSAVSVGGLNYRVGDVLTTTSDLLAGNSGTSGFGFTVPVSTVTAGTPTFVVV